MRTYKTDKYIFLLTRRRKRICIGATFLISILFILYQLIMHNMLSNTHHVQKLARKNLVRGTHIQEQRFYTPVNGKFTCFKSGEVIDFSRVNDNYCDCADNTDEPGTNACPDGFFYCSAISNNKQYPKMVPSSKVNDGICDCCDGSEEYTNNDVLKDFSKNLQVKMNHFLVPCPNVC